MSEFRGELYGCRGPASRLGSKDSGITARANTWRVQVEVEMSLHQRGTPNEYRSVSIFARPYNGSGSGISLFNGTEKQLLARIARRHRDAKRRRAAKDEAERGPTAVAKTLRTGRVFTLKQSDILKCPHVIMVAEHYHESGQCRCWDESHTVMAEWGYVWDGNQWQAGPEEDA